MKWKHLFQKSMLDKARVILAVNGIQNVEYRTRGAVTYYRAEVTDLPDSRRSDSGTHYVEVGVKGDYVVTWDCSCPSKGFCVHQAVLCLALDKAFKEAEKEPEKIVYPFKSKDKSYHYFDLEELFSDFTITKENLSEAEELLKSEWYYNRTSIEYGELTGLPMVDAYSGSGHIRFDRERIYDTYCRDYSCDAGSKGFTDTADGRRYPCKHLLAAMLKARNYISENPDVDNTDESTGKLINIFRNRSLNARASSSGDDGGEIKLVPRLILQYGEFALSFKMGSEKMYVVKSLSKLVNAVESGARMTMSTSLELDFRFQHFDTAGTEYYKFIRNCYRDLEHINENERSRSSYYEHRDISDMGSSLDLYGRRVDDFFDIFSKYGECEFIDKDEDRKSVSLSLTEKMPEINLTLEKEKDSKGVFHGVKLSGELPVMLAGASSVYSFVSDEKKAKVCRLDEETSEKFSPLLGLDIDSSLELYAGRKNLAEFYRTVLPVFRKFANITEKDAEEVAAFLPPEAKFGFYIDLVDEVPACSVKVHYDDKTNSPLDWLTSGFRPQDYRDEVAEKDVIRQVRAYFPLVNIQNDSFRCDESDETEAYYLLKNGVDALMNLGEVYMTDAFKSLKVRPPVKVSVGVSVQSDLLNLQISTTDLTSRELLDILASYRQKKKFHRLKNGDFIDIEDSVAGLDDMLSGMHITDKEFLKGNIKIPAYRALYLDKMLEENDEIYADRDRRFRKLIKEFKTVNDSDFDVPESLKTIMRPYQVDGFKWLSTLSSYGFGGILADDMGLGKTLQMISVILSDKEERGASFPSLIICPASLVYNWVEELKRFAPSLKTAALAGTKAERSEIISSYKDYDVLITSYSLIGRDITEYEDKEFNFQVIDEAQYIKNRGINITKAVKLIKSRKKFALTGTPIENRLSELWSIFDFLMPGFLYRYEEFRKRYETPIMKKDDEDASKELRRMTAPFILRRLKKDVLKDLPDKMEETRYARFSDEQQKLYDAQVTKLRAMVEGSDDESIRKDKIRILAEITRTRQICCDPSLVFEDYSGESAKRLACIDLIRSAIEGEHRILLFSQFTSMLDLLAKDLETEGISFFRITGETPKKRRLELVDEFNNGTVPVFLISLRAGGTGLNLTGADVVIHYDPWWNAAVQNQATDRAHRIGQTKVVTVYKLIAAGSMEEKIEKMQETKKDLAEEILSGANESIGSMSREELLDLIGS